MPGMPSKGRPAARASSPSRVRGRGKRRSRSGGVLVQLFLADAVDRGQHRGQLLDLGQGRVHIAFARGMGQDDQVGLRHALAAFAVARSEEHTSELQSQSNLVCRLLLEKKKKYY